MLALLHLVPSRPPPGARVSNFHPPITERTFRIAAFLRVPPPVGRTFRIAGFPVGPYVSRCSFSEGTFRIAVFSVF